MADRVGDFLANAQDAPVELPVVELLDVFGYRARTLYTVLEIYQALCAAGLTCMPDLTEGSRDDIVRVGTPAAAGCLAVQTRNGEESR